MKKNRLGPPARVILKRARRKQAQNKKKVLPIAFPEWDIGLNLIANVEVVDRAGDVSAAVIVDTSRFDAVAITLSSTEGLVALKLRQPEDRARVHPTPILPGKIT